MGISVIGSSGAAGVSDGYEVILSGQTLAGGSKIVQDIPAGNYVLQATGTGTLDISPFSGALNELDATESIVVNGEGIFILTLAGNAKGLYFEGADLSLVLKKWPAFNSASVGVVAPATSYFTVSATVPLPASGGDLRAMGDFFWYSVDQISYWSVDGVTWTALSTAGLTVSGASTKVWYPLAVSGNEIAGMYYYGTWSGLSRYSAAVTRWNGTGFDPLVVISNTAPFTFSGNQWYGNIISVDPSNGRFYFWAAGGGAVGSLYYAEFTYNSSFGTGSITGGDNNSGLGNSGSDATGWLMYSWVYGTSSYYIWDFMMQGYVNRQTIYDPINCLSGQASYLIRKQDGTAVRIVALSPFDGDQYITWTAAGSGVGFFASAPTLDTPSYNATFPVTGTGSTRFFYDNNQSRLVFIRRNTVDGLYVYNVWYTEDGVTWTTIGAEDALNNHAVWMQKTTSRGINPNGQIVVQNNGIIGVI